MGELVKLSDDLNVITAEINSYKQIAGQSIFEIGRRLKGVRDNPEEYGLNDYRDWEKWCNEQVGFSRGNANKYIKVYEEFDSPVSRNLGIRALYEMATLPQEEREKEHLTSKGDKKKVDEMTVRELQELKRKLKEEERAKEQAEKQAEQARQSEEIALKKLEEEQAKEPKVIEKEVDKTDYERIELLEKELAEKKDEILHVEKQQDELRLLKQKLEKTNGVEKELKEVKKELEEKQVQLDTLSMEQVKTKNKRLIYQNVSYLTRDIGGWIRRTKQYINERNSLSGDPEIHRTIEGLKKTLQETLDEVSSWTEVGGEGSIVEEIGGEVIDADFSEVE